MEKQVEESMGKIATASDTKAAKVDHSLSGEDSATSLGALDDVLDLDMPEGSQSCYASFAWQPFTK